MSEARDLLGGNLQQMSDYGKIEALIARLAALGGWKSARDVVGTDADDAFQAELERLLAEFPFVARAQDWLEFLRRFGGGMWSRASDGLSLGLYGFSHDVTMHILDGPGDPVGDGILLFGDISLPTGGVELAFGFEATGERRWGVYRFVDGGDPEWYCESFHEWLERLVEREGRLLD